MFAFLKTKNEAFYANDIWQRNSSIIGKVTKTVETARPAESGQFILEKIRENLLSLLVEANRLLDLSNSSLDAGKKKKISRYASGLWDVGDRSAGVGSAAVINGYSNYIAATTSPCLRSTNPAA
jgi:hypothetical protein